MIIDNLQRAIATAKRFQKRVTFVTASLVTVVAPLVATAPASAAAAYHTPVVIVHGYGSCQDVGQNMVGPASEQYYTGTAASDIHEIAYYGCDTDGESIQGLGPLNTPDCLSSDPNVQANCPAFLRSPDNDFLNTDLRRYSYELSWYLYNKFGSTGPVALVGQSMGGLIITYAIQQIAAHNPNYPSALAVQTIVTFSTPFGGATVSPAGTFEATQMAPSGTNSLVPTILAAGAKQMYAGKYTIWAAEGSSAGCDAIPASSTLALSLETFKVDYTTPCYTHTGYLWDAFAPKDATGKLNGTAFTGGYHSLDYMHYLISYQENLYNH